MATTNAWSLLLPFCSDVDTFSERSGQGEAKAVESSKEYNMGNPLSDMALGTYCNRNGHCIQPDTDKTEQQFVDTSWERWNVEAYEKAAKQTCHRIQIKKANL